MNVQKALDKMVEKTAKTEENVTEIKKIANLLDIWAKENDYELIPVINLLNNKINKTLKILRK